MSEREVIARIDRFEGKFDAFMETHNKSHENLIVDQVRWITKSEELQREIAKHELELCNAFSKIRAIDKKIIYATGAFASFAFIVQYFLSHYLK